MNTNSPRPEMDDEPDPSELDDIPEHDFSHSVPSPVPAMLANGFELVIEGVVTYRLIDTTGPAVLAEYPESRSLFRAIVLLTDTGTPSESLAMDVRLPDGEYVPQVAGLSLVSLARSALGIADGRRSRIAEG